MKIKNIQIENIKAIDSLQADFNGCSAIITGRNGSGKTTLITMLPERIRGEKPELILKDTTKNGSSTLELTTGEKFAWEIAVDGKEKLNFFTKEGYKTAVTKEIRKKFFPVLFDIDNFLSALPKEQSKMLQKLVNIDLSMIELAYKTAYDDRTLKNKILENVKAKLASFNPVPEKKETVLLAELSAKKEEIRAKLTGIYLDNKTANDKLRNKYQAALNTERERKERHDKEVERLNSEHKSAQSTVFEILSKMSIIGFDVTEIKPRLQQHIAIKYPSGTSLNFVPNEINEPDFITPEIPDDKELRDVDQLIMSANETNAAAKSYLDYVEVKKEFENAQSEASDADIKVKDLMQQKTDMIKSAKLPDGFEFTEDGINYNGLPLNKNQIARSEYYIAGCKLAAMTLGEVKALHFDASTLDRNNLAEIENWAASQDLQLLIERPDFDGGEIQYTLIVSE